MKFWWTRKKCTHAHSECGRGSCPKKCTSLSDITAGKCVCVKKHRSCGADRQRLLDLGIVPCARVNVVNKAPLGGSIHLRVGESNLVLSHSDAEQIEVDLVTP